MPNNYVIAAACSISVFYDKMHRAKVIGKTEKLLSFVPLPKLAKGWRSRELNVLILSNHISNLQHRSPTAKPALSSDFVYYH